MKTITQNSTWTQYRDQQIIVQPQWIHLYHSSHTDGSGNITEEGRERLKGPEYQEVSLKAVSHRNVRIYKTEIKTISMNMVTWKGKVFMGFHLQQRTSGNYNCWKET